MGGGRAGSVSTETTIVCGVDEAGRGPLAGPVFAAAVILDRRRPIPGIADSKTLTAKVRERLAASIRTKSRAWSVASADVDEIDRLNILQAALLAMQRAVGALEMAPDVVLVDGLQCPRLEVSARAVVRGDDCVREIAAASILAKTARDAAMLELHALHPQYGFDRHKGYPTAQHLAALRKYGATRAHRRSFAPVRSLLQQGEFAWS